MDYQYGRRLGSHEIRLLRPVTINERVLSFTVRETIREAAPSYTAVSYTWGEGPPSEVIHLDGQRFRVRKNLWSCLDHLRHDSAATGDLLWVDAICINQANDNERNSQVLLMDQAYRDAASVLVSSEATTSR